MAFAAGGVDLGGAAAGHDADVGVGADDSDGVDGGGVEREHVSLFASRTMDSSAMCCASSRPLKGSTTVRGVEG